MNYFDYSHIIFVGTGVGITPLYSVLSYTIGLASDIIEKYRAGTKKISNQTSACSYDGEASKIFDFSNHSVERSIRNTVKGLHFGSKSFQRGEASKSLITSFDIASKALISEEVSSTKSSTSSKELNLDDMNEEEQDELEKTQNCLMKIDKIIDSLTISLLVFFIISLSQTLLICLEIYGDQRGADYLGLILSSSLVLYHGGQVAVSLLTTKYRNYSKIGTIILDLIIIAVNTLVMFFSVRELKNHSIDTKRLMAFAILHGVCAFVEYVRVLHVFYLTLKSTKPKSGKSQSTSQELKSIHGILVSQYFSGTEFVAKSLLPMIQGRLSRLFTLEAFATRDSVDNANELNDFASLRNSITPANVGKEYFRCGRPNWKHIMRREISRAHSHSVDSAGETIGVFFCGAPAVSKALQDVAREVTMEHQFMQRKFCGTQCKCKIVVHSENF